MYLQRSSIISRVVIQLSIWSGMLANWNAASTVMQLKITYWDSSIALIKGIRCTVSSQSVSAVNGFVLQLLLIPSSLERWLKLLQGQFRLCYLHSWIPSWNEELFCTLPMCRNQSIRADLWEITIWTNSKSKDYHLNNPCNNFLRNDL